MNEPMELKVKLYNPKKHTITSDWLATLKIDGVQAIRSNGTWMSRAGKPLYNLPDDVPDGIYEVFFESWSKTISMVRTQDGQMVNRSCLYMLSPELDKRLELVARASCHEELMTIFRAVKGQGHEGLVLRGPDGTLLKVKDKVTYDVPVIGYQPGRGKHEGKMGALITPMGKVGTGFSDADREWWARHVELAIKGHEPRCPIYPDYNGPRPFGEGICNCKLRGFIIEVECMELTSDGKFRHPRYVRLREDKACG